MQIGSAEVIDREFNAVYLDVSGHGLPVIPIGASCSGQAQYRAVQGPTDRAYGRTEGHNSPG
jgi:hypothetical protein